MIETQGIVLSRPQRRRLMRLVRKATDAAYSTRSMIVIHTGCGKSKIDIADAFHELATIHAGKQQGVCDTLCHVDGLPDWIQELLQVHLYQAIGSSQTPPQPANYPTTMEATMAPHPRRIA